MVDIQQFLDNERTDEEKVLKELIDSSKNIEVKTDLSHEQIVEICKLKHISKKYDLSGLDEFVKLFMTLNVSKNRQGRKEFIQAIQANRENKENLGMFGNMRERLK